MGLDGLAGEIDRLVGEDPASISDPDSIVELHRLLERLTAVTARADATFADSGAWGLDNARSATAWLAWRTHSPAPDHARLIKAGMAMRTFGQAGRAWLAGDIGAAHVHTFARLTRPAVCGAARAAEDMLVGFARQLGYGAFSRAVRYFEQLADEDGAEDDTDRLRANRAVFLSQSFQGAWLGKITLDPIAGTILNSELRRIETVLYAADVAEATERLGRKPTWLELARTPAQRRADALVEMATRSAATPPAARRPKPLFSVLVDYTTLTGRVCELANRTVVTPGALVPWLTEAMIERVVFGPDSRPIDVGRTARLFRGATRRAIEVRDMDCYIESCDTPAERCDVDHVIPYEHNGPTTTDNGRLACPYHNRHRHQHPPHPPDDD